MDKITARILIVDDQEANTRLLRHILARAGYHNVAATSDPRNVLTLWDEAQPDLMLLDLHMPHLDGFAVLEGLHTRISEAGYLPVLMLMADIQPAVKSQALALGAKDFLNKPFDVSEVVLRISNLLDTRILYRQLEKQKQTLEQRVLERTYELEDAQVGMLERLALASESRGDGTGEHTKRVGELAEKVARLAGWPKPS